MNHITYTFFKQTLQISSEMRQFDRQIQSHNDSIRRIRSHCDQTQKANQQLQFVQERLKHILQKLSACHAEQIQQYQPDEQFALEMQHKNVTQQKMIDRSLIYLPHESLEKVEKYLTTISDQPVEKIFKSGLKHYQKTENLTRNKQKYQQIYERKKNSYDEAKKQ